MLSYRGCILSHSLNIVYSNIGLIIIYTVNFWYNEFDVLDFKFVITL